MIIDGGGNIGLAAIFFARKFPTATIYTVEPSADNFAILAKNVAPYSNIVPIQAALWYNNGMLDLSDPGAGSWGFVTSDQDSNMGHPVIEKVIALSITELMKNHGILTIDLLKLDIEGSEREVLANSQDWINAVKIIIVELHESMREGCEVAWKEAIREFPIRWISGENECAARGGSCVRNDSD